MAMDACNQAAFTSDGQRWEWDVLAHRVLQGVVLGDLLFFFLKEFLHIESHVRDLCRPLAINRQKKKTLVSSPSLGFRVLGQNLSRIVLRTLV
jgi:hypothetical protein